MVEVWKGSWGPMTTVFGIGTQVKDGQKLGDVATREEALKLIGKLPKDTVIREPIKDPFGIR